MEKQRETKKGITLIALVVTVIILLILALISIKIFLGDGMLGITKNTVNEWNKSSEEEKSSLSKLANKIKENREERDKNNLKPLLEIEIIDITKDTITVKSDARRMEDGEYSYYIKYNNSGEEYSLKETKKEDTYTFEGLIHNREYQIKVVAKNKYGETAKESKAITTKQAYEVTYNINTDNAKVELYEKGESVLEPSFTPEISGWTFVGWREDNTASAEVISERIVEEDKITLYAVFKRVVTLSYNANGGSSTPTKQTGTRYYNNGNNVNPKFTLAASISRSGYTFQKWRLNSTSGTAYNAKGSITLSSNATMYATWTANVVTVATTSLNGAISPTSGTIGVQSGSYSTSTSYFIFDPKGTGKWITKIAGTYRITWNISSSNSSDKTTNCTFYKNSSQTSTIAVSGVSTQSNTFTVTLAVNDTWHINYLRLSNAGITFNFTMQKI